MIRAELNLLHPELAGGRWAGMGFAEQMGNIGSEISRLIKAKTRGNGERMTGAAERVIELFELFELSTDCNAGNSERLKELCRGKEEFYDYVFGDNSFGTDVVRMLRYYDQFALMVRG